jgi:hypothetical protein
VNDPATGKPSVDPDGKLTLKVGGGDYEMVVTNAWGGVTKMFQLTDAPAPMVAVTAGLAKLNERTSASLVPNSSRIGRR